MSEQSDRDPAYHPSWCDPEQCTTPPARPPFGTPTGGAHRSAVVSLNLQATARGETGTVTGQLLQTLRPGAEVFLVWLIGRAEVGQLRLEDAGPLALLIAEGLGALEGD